MDRREDQDVFDNAPVEHLVSSLRQATLSEGLTLPSRNNGVRLSKAAFAARRQLATWSRAKRLALSGLLGIFSAFSFAPFSLWLLMLGAFCGLVWLLDTSTSARHSAACGWFFGFGHFATGLYWISISFGFQADMPVWLGWVGVAGLAGYLAIYPALALWLASKLWSSSPARVLVLAGTWAAAEWLRGHLLSGFPWNAVAQIWADTAIMFQSVRFFGAYGLGLLTVALFSSLALVADRTRAARAAMLLAPFGASLLLADGWWRVTAGQPASERMLRVHLVQANIRQDLKMNPERQLEILTTYEDMSLDALRERGPGLVIWPETAVQYDVEGDGVTRFRLARLLGGQGTLILGAVGQRTAPDGRWIGSRNSLLAVAADGDVTAVYDKRRLVPFGEYLPASSLLARIGLRSLAAGSARFLPGDRAETLAPGVPPFSPLICYEIIFPGEVVNPSARPEWLLNISNDAWFGNSSGPHQHLAQARLRAVEEGLPVVRSTPTGISAVIDPLGRVTARTTLGERTVLTATVPPPMGETIYARRGDGLFFLLAAASLVIGAFTRFRSRRRS